MKRRNTQDMDNFVVSARKYRPATFDMVVGQPSITSTLKNAIRNNQLAQAFLFCGPRGVGKTTCARILAKTINCMNPRDKTEPCDQCESCLSFNRSASFNIHELDAASNNSVDDIRNLVDQVRIPPQVGKYKVYIIDEVHMLSAAAFNAFLKTLEEPPPYAKFILATTEKHKIIPTILSRCQIFDFRRIVVKDIADYLAYVAKSEGVDTEEEALHVIAQKADGAMRDALSFFDQLVSFSGNQLTYQTVTEHLNILDHAYYFRIMDQALSHDTSGILLTLDEIISRGFDGQHFLIGLGEHLRNLLVCQDPKTVTLMEISSNLQQKYSEQAGKCSPAYLLQALEIHNQYDQSYKTANNKRLQLELVMLLISAAAVKSGSPEPEKKISLIPPPADPKKPGPEPGIPLTPKPEENKTVAPPVAAVPKPSAAPSASRTISIKPENHTPKKVGATGEETPAGPVNQKEFTQEKLEKVWTYYTESIAGQYPNFYSILSTRKPVLKENFLIYLQLDNKTQEITLKDRRADLLDFLRNELGNQSVQMESVVIETATQSKPYTADEKFRSMVEKNPELKVLKEGLDLEIEF
ncbi:MAG: DNA polymerase III subunit gamma/tau [Bacteroidales bacterium]|nr:DNA polymerase III subunit gamma/tau [Bacteroidales bacterium]